MSLRSRLKAYISGQRYHGEKASKVRGAGFGGGKAEWSKDRYDVHAKETYLRNVVAFRCIDEIAKAVASVPLKIYRDGTEVENHWFLDLLKRPNPYDSSFFLKIKMMAYLIMAGNSYIEGVRTTLSGPEIKELYVHRPDRMQILVDKEQRLLTGYEYTVDGIKTKWDVDTKTQRSDILHLKGFHPLDDWYGSGPTKATAYEIDTSNQASEWNMRLMQNMGRPGMVLLFGQPLGDDQFELVKKQLEEAYSGPANAGKNLILSGTGADGGSNGRPDVKPFGFTPQEMDFILGNQDMARRIALGYGVPPMLLGIPGDNTYSNQKEARVAFWETTVLYALIYLCEEINNWALYDVPEYLTYDLDEIPALSPRRQELWDRANASDFLTVNERRAMVGYEPRPEGDVILIPATELPLGEEPDMGGGDGSSGDGNA